MKNKIINWFKTMTWKKALKLFLFALLITVIIIVALFIYRTVINPKAAFNTQATNHVQVSAAPGATPIKTTQPDVGEQFKTDRVNILVLGMDSSEQRFETVREDFRTDTMLLVSVDFDKKSVDMITIPRDSYVNVKNATGKLYKVNSAAFFGGGLCDNGFLNACDTISGVFGGLPVNYYVAANMDGLKALVDAVGGVYFDVDVNASLDGVTLTEGYQLLDGTKALTYCRVRKGIGTDIDRQQRQQQMLVAIFDNLKKNGKINDVGPIYESLKDMVYTNLSFEQICALGVFFSGFDSLDNINKHVLKGEYHWAYDVYFYLLDQKAKADLVKEIFGEDIDIDQKHDLYYVLKHASGGDAEHTKDKEDSGDDAKDNGDSGDNTKDNGDSGGDNQNDPAPTPSDNTIATMAPETPPSDPATTPDPATSEPASGTTSEQPIA